MTEEKKDETVNAAIPPVEAVKQEVVAPASAPAPEAVAAQAPAEVKAEPVVVKKEKPTNCASCKKSIKGKRWYYRNGQYFCTKRCWSTTKVKPDAKTEEAAPKA